MVAMKSKQRAKEFWWKTIRQRERQKCFYECNLAGERSVFRLPFLGTEFLESTARWRAVVAEN